MALQTLPTASRTSPDQQLYVKTVFVDVVYVMTRKKLARSERVVRCNYVIAHAMEFRASDRKSRYSVTIFGSAFACSIQSPTCISVGSFAFLAVFTSASFACSVAALR